MVSNDRDAIVSKFGGSSLADAAAYDRVAGLLLAERERRSAVVAVVSAQVGETERHRALLASVDPAAGDEVSAAFLSLADVSSTHLLRAAVEARGGTATVLPQHGTGVTTDSRHMWARITGLDARPVREAAASSDVVIIPGGPAADAAGRPTWMGKNSSDLSAVAAAVNLGARTVDIYSDVDGVYTADPRLVPDTRCLRTLDHRSAQLIAARGAKVLHRRALALAEEHGITVRCRLNTPPYGIGTQLHEGAEPGAAVVIDLRSQLVECASTAQAEDVRSVLDAEGIPTVRPNDLGGSLVVVTGGFVDVPLTLRRLELPGRIRPGRLVSLVEDGVATSHLADDDEHAVTLGAKLHADLLTAGA